MSNLQIILDFSRTIAIVAAAIVAMIQLRNVTRVSKVSASIQLTTSHRDIWMQLLNNRSLERILSKDVNVESVPPSLSEEMFVVMVTNHMNAAFEADKAGVHTISPSDMRQFFDLPIPKKVWQDIRYYQPRDFVQFIESRGSRKILAI